MNYYSTNVKKDCNPVAKHEVCGANNWGGVNRVWTFRLGIFINNLFVKDSKGLSINTDETLVSFDVSALFTSIPVPVALEVINKKLTDHISQEVIEVFMEQSHHIQKDKFITLLELVLNNCVFSFQQKFYKQL